MMLKRTSESEPPHSLRFSLWEPVALQVRWTHHISNNSALTIKDWIRQRCGFGSNRRCFCDFAHWVANLEERHGPRPRRQHTRPPLCTRPVFSILHHDRP